MDRFGTYSTHAQACDVTHVQSATQWTASEHILHMPKPVFKVLRNGLLRNILYPLPMPRETRVQETHLDDSPQTIFHIGFLFLTFRHRLLRYSWYLDKSGSQRATVKVGGRLATVRLAG